MTGTTFFTSTLTRPSDLVKAQIAALGVRMGDLAAEAGLSKSGLSTLVNGHARNRARHYAVLRALRKLSGCSHLTLEGLWGDLLLEAALEAA